MSDTHPIVAEVTSDVFTTIERMAGERGLSVEAFAGDIVRHAAEEEAELLASIQEGRAQIARGEFLTHEELVASLQQWKRERKRAA